MMDMGTALRRYIELYNASSDTKDPCPWRHVLSTRTNLCCAICVAERPETIERSEDRRQERPQMLELKKRQREIEIASYSFRA